jgi:hypothetical protein
VTGEIWAPALQRVHAALDVDGAAAAEEDGIDAARAALAAATGALANALGAQASGNDSLNVDLVHCASRLVSVVADVVPVRSAHDAPRRHAAETLASRLRAHEAAVLEGELTYALNAQDTEDPAERAADALARLSGPSGATVADLVVLRRGGRDRGTAGPRRRESGDHRTRR